MEFQWLFLKTLVTRMFKSRYLLLSYTHTIPIALNVYLVLICALQQHVHVQLLRVKVLETNSSRHTTKAKPNKIKTNKKQYTPILQR